MTESHRGMALLLTVLILSALLAVSLGIFTVVYTELRINGEMSKSFTALYAADQGMEQLLYCDRVSSSACTSWTCSGSADCTYTPPKASLPNGACITLIMTRSGGATTLRSIGEYRCGDSITVKRTVSASY